MKTNVLGKLGAMALGALVLISCSTVRVTGAEEFKSLFNGRDLTGWDGNSKLWSVKDGVIHGETTAADPIKSNTFLIWTNGVVGDFELHLSYKIKPVESKGSGNSGIQYRSKIKDPKNWVVGGYQADFETGKTYSGILYEEQGRGILAQRGQKTVIKPTDDKKHKVEVVGETGKSSDIQANIKDGDWNQYVVIAKGNHLTHIINGKTTVDVTDEDEAHAAKSGVLALQIHTGPPMIVEFKDVKIKELK